MGSKKVLRKVMDPLKLPDPLDLWGEKAEKAEKQARQAADQQETQARAQAAQSAEAAAQAQRQIQLDSERQQALQAAGEAQQVDTALPTIELAVDVQPVQSKRKKFQGQSLGGSAGSSLRV